MAIRFNPAQWSVSEPVGSPPLQYFEHRHNLRFPAGSLAEEIVLDPAGTTLRGRFLLPGRGAVLSARSSARFGPDDFAIPILRIQSDPVGVRIGLVDEGETVFFWMTSLMPGDPVDVGGLLAGALQNLLPRIASPFPAIVDVPLVVAADIPCLFELQALAVPYHLAIESLPGGEEKKVLRFEEGRVSSGEVLLQLPAGARVASAVLETVTSLREDRPVEAGAGGAAPTETSGVRLESGVQAAQAFTPPEAVSVSGVALGLMGLAAGTGLRVELQEDSGRKLAEGSVVIERAGEKLWATVLFPESVILPSQQHWILATATRGGAVWLARSGATPVRLLDRSSPAGLEALVQLLSPTGSRPAQLELRLGGTVIPASEQPDDRRSYDLTAALNQHLAAQGSAATVDAPLLFTSIAPGMLTVYPPRIVYDPPA
ncbi:MAG TPA: hypothetical protein VF756_11700 [Thermoanaerobaculia bacterium]